MIELLDYNNRDILKNAGLIPKDIYQTEEYLQLEAEMNNARPIIFIYSRNGFKAALPVILRKIEGTKYFDCSSPYGYPGILFSDRPNQDQAEDFFNALTELCRKSGIISIFIRLHPYFDQFKYEHLPELKQITHGNTICIDLQQSVEQLKSDYSENHKRNIKKLKIAGFTTEINNWNAYADFQKAYFETMTHVKAGGYYFFNENYFSKLISVLGHNLDLVTVSDTDGNLAAGALFFRFDEIVQYHLGGTMDSYRQSGPSKLIFDEAISHYSTHRFKWLHLGGGVGSKNDELFRFKQGFSKSTWSFSTMRCITDIEIYDQLAQKNSTENSDYFPLYRKP